MNMDREPTCDHPGFVAAADELTGLLAEVVRRIHTAPSPHGAAAAVIDRAALWPAVAARPTGAQTNGAGRRWWAVAAAVALVAVTIGLVVFHAGRKQVPPEISAVTKSIKPDDTVSTVPSTAAVPAAPFPNDGAQERGAEPIGNQAATIPGGVGPAAPARGAGVGGMAGASPSRSMAVSGGSGTFIVASGGDKPIKLGERQPWSRDNRLHIWNWAAGDQSRPLDAKAPGSMAISPDGKWIVTSEGERINAATGAATKLEKFPDDVQGLRFSPAGDALLLQVGSYTGPAGKEGAAAWMLDFPAGTVRFQVPGQWAYTFAAAFSPDGGQFYVMDKDKVLRRWDAKTGKELRRYEPAFDNSIRAIAVSPDGKHVAATGTSGDAYLWEAVGGKLLHKLRPAGPDPDSTKLNGMDSLVFSPDGKLLAGGALFAIVLWDVETGKVARLFQPNASSGATYVRFSADGTKLTAVREFHGTNGPNGEDLLVYPTVQEWVVDRDSRVP